MKTRKSTPKAIAAALKRRGVAHERADRIFRLLLADGPMTAKELAERLDLTPNQVTGSGAPLELLEAEGRVWKKPGAGSIHGARYMWYAKEDTDD